MITQRMKTGLKVILGGLIVACIVALPLYRKIQSISIPQSYKLAACTNDILEMAFRAPKGGHVYQLVLGPPAEFTGDVEILRDSNTIQKFAISSEAVTPCNWLSRHGISTASILTWNLNTPLFQTDVIEFSKPPGANSAVWVTWRQSYGSLKRDRHSSVGDTEKLHTSD